jgi:hypothetical protein
MMLFTFSISHHIYRLEQKLRGTRVKRRKKKTAVVAYADDVSLRVFTPEEFSAIEEEIWYYVDATGAKLNIVKSHSMSVGSWDTTRTVTNISYNREVKVLVIQMANTTAQSTVSSWSLITNMLRLLAREAYIRHLDLVQRIQFVHTYILANLYCTAQVLLAPSVHIHEIVSAVAWFIWQVDIFRVTLSTLHKKKERGGWGLTDVERKCRSLLLYRTWIQTLRD